MQIFSAQRGLRARHSSQFSCNSFGYTNAVKEYNCNLYKSTNFTDIDALPSGTFSLYQFC